jgi:circadian clock protein KaiC
MNDPNTVTVHKLATGVPGLDAVLGEGLPEFSFNILAGSPGSGKTTLAHQIVFATATPERPALYFTALGEPALKMLRYQQQFRFFDPSKLSSCMRFINLSEVVLGRDRSRSPRWRSAPTPSRSSRTTPSGFDTWRSTPNFGRS